MPLPKNPAPEGKQWEWMGARTCSNSRWVCGHYRLVAAAAEATTAPAATAAAESTTAEATAAASTVSPASAEPAAAATATEE